MTHTEKLLSHPRVQSISKPDPGEGIQRSDSKRWSFLVGIAAVRMDDGDDSLMQALELAVEFSAPDPLPKTLVAGVDIPAVPDHIQGYKARRILTMEGIEE